MKKLKAFWNKDKNFRILIWSLFNVVIAFTGTYLSWLEWPMAFGIAALAVPFLNLITKYVNIKFFNDLWVTNVDTDPKKS